MKTNTETYKICIQGDEYHIVSDEAYDHIIKATDKLSGIIASLSKNATPKQKYTVAILAGLQLASELLHSQSDKGSSESRIKELSLKLDQALSSL